MVRVLLGVTCGGFGSYLKATESSWLSHSPRSYSQACVGGLAVGALGLCLRGGYPVLSFSFFFFEAELVGLIVLAHQNNGRWIDPGAFFLSAILVSMKKAREGSGRIGSQLGFLGSAVLLDPGTRNVLFLVYIPRSRMGFPVVGHFIFGLCLTFAQT